MSIENIGDAVKTVYVVIVTNAAHPLQWGVMAFKTKSDAQSYIAAEETYWETQMKDKNGQYMAPKKNYKLKEYVEKE